jgi:DNA-binding transcriptional LysR family regulator
MFDWNDLRHFLAVARSGSTLAAAKEMDVNQTTVARRIAALEAAMGTALFERSRHGYRLTAHGEEIVATAERVEAEMAGLIERFAAEDRKASGILRLTAPETLATRVVMPILGEFRRAFPDVSVDVIVELRQLDLARGEADVAIRAAPDLTSSAIFGRKLFDLRWAIFCSRDIAEHHGMPGGPADIARFPVVQSDGPIRQLPAYRWLDAAAAGASVPCRCNKIEEMVSAGVAGLGLVLLPAMAGAMEPGLVRCFPPIADVVTPIWLVAPERLRAAPRLRALMDFLPPRMKARVLPYGDGLRPAGVTAAFRA